MFIDMCTNVISHVTSDADFKGDK